MFWDLENIGLHLLRPAAARYALLRYEDVSADPAAALSGALARLGLTGEPGFLRLDRITLGPNHTVAGNPLRFRRGEVPIRPDVEWRGRLGRERRWGVTALTWPLLLRYGFSLRDGGGPDMRTPAEPGGR